MFAMPQIPSGIAFMKCEVYTFLLKVFALNEIIELASEKSYTG